MKLQNFKYYLVKLIADGHKWQYLDINGAGIKPKFYFSLIQWIILAFAVAGLFFLKDGFNKDFVGYIIASLSIFIGLFLTLILTVFDKFQKIDFEKKNLSEKERVFLIQRKNFFKQFTALTSYSILISLFCIILLSLSLLSNFFNQNLFSYSLIEQIKEIKLGNIFYLLQVIFLVIYRVAIIYFFMDFILIVVYALSSIYNYMTLEYDKKKINKNGNE